MLYFTSDTHFYHKNVIKYCERPFKSVEEMNAKMIENWQNTVQDNDTIIHCGDFAFCGQQKAKAILEQLPGKKVLVRGNHDPQTSRIYNQGWDHVYEELVITLGRHRVRVSHYPFAPSEEELSRENEQYDVRYLSRRPRRDGKWLIHGHVHERWKINGNMINVGVDVWEFKPVSEAQILAVLTC